MAKGGKRNDSMDKPSSVMPSSNKMPSHVNKASKSPGLDMTKTHPLHEGKKSSNPYSAYKAN